MSDPARILVVDDERPIRRALEMTLSRAGYRVDTAGTAAEALASAALQPPDMVVLDLMLPDGDGAQVCRELREWSSAPVLLVSVVEDEAEKVRALDAGADDYITKPFGVDELLARVRALLRRSSRDERGASVINLGGVRIDLPRRRVLGADGDVHLTPTEFDLLKALAIADGRVLTHRMLLRTVWGPGYADESQVLRVHTARLRDKLQAHGLPRDTIETVTGVGYRLNRPDGS